MAEYLLIGDVARITGYSIDTLRRWADKGELPARKTPGGTRMFRREDVNALPKRGAPKVSPPPTTVGDAA